MKRFLCLFSAGVVILFSACDGTTGSDTSTQGTDVVLDSTFGEGSFSVSGTVSLPDSVTGNYAQVTITRKNAGVDNFSEVDSAEKKSSGAEISYKINNLPAGDYQIRMRYDVDGDGSFGGTNDYDGYYNGTPLVPKDFADADTLTITDSAENVDFGIGTLNR